MEYFPYVKYIIQKTSIQTKSLGAKASLSRAPYPPAARLLARAATFSLSYELSIYLRNSRLKPRIASHI